MTRPAPDSRPRSDSIIGAQMRIDGHIDFAGSIRIHGAVRGDITGADDPEAKVVVAESGHVAGTVRAPNIMVHGRIDGPLYSDRTIDVFPRGHCSGGAQYNSLSVQEGGVLDGVLQLACGLEMARPRKSQRGSGGRLRRDAPVDTAAGTGEPSDREVGKTSAVLPRQPAGPIVRRHRMLAWVGGIAFIVLVTSWAMRGPPKPDPGPMHAIAPQPGSPAEPASLGSTSAAAPQAAPVPPVVPGGPQNGVPAKPPAPVPAVAAPAATAGPAPSSPVPPARPGSEDASPRIVAIEGGTADKPSGTVFLITREATVIQRRKRSDNGTGLRIEVARGRNISLQVGRDEVLRVASGHDIDLFYQGRKIPPATVEAGSWMGFVPATRATPSGAISPNPADPGGAGAPQTASPR